MDPIRKIALAQKRRWRVRARVNGTAERPRLSVHFSNKHIYAQCIDDEKAVTLVASTSLGAKEPSKVSLRANVSGAKNLGDIFAQKTIAAGIRRVVFDRGARRYHGCVRAFADAARAAGLEF
ncbi:MAG: 50S ribosomal protein L18 [Puniceicoccales bacterium]|jgi:large subunit ribosomal protein L18|nr:50S ribosomal protein L18 [Puniceicoccales bacterium]